MAKTERSHLSRLITSHYTIKKRDIDQFIRLGAPANPGKLYTSLRAYSEKLIPWSKFKYRGARGGVNVEIVKGRNIFIRGNFIASVGSHTGVFQRANQDKVNPRETRKERRDSSPYFYYTELPIKERVGPSAGIMAGTKRNTAAIMKSFYDAFRNEVLRRLSAGL